MCVHCTSDTRDATPTVRLVLKDVKMSKSEFRFLSPLLYFYSKCGFCWLTFPNFIPSSLFQNGQKNLYEQNQIIVDLKCEYWQKLWCLLMYCNSFICGLFHYCPYLDGNQLNQKKSEVCDFSYRLIITSVN